MLEISEESASVVDKVANGRILVDGLGVGDVGNIVLRDRQLLAQHGIIILVSVFQHGTGELLAGPDIITRGFVYVRESEELMEEAQEVAYGTIVSCRGRGIGDWTKIKWAGITGWVKSEFLIADDGQLPEEDPDDFTPADGADPNAEPGDEKIPLYFTREELAYMLPILESASEQILQKVGRG